MSLSTRSQRLLDSARREVQPTPDDLRRVRARLGGALASGLADGSSSMLPLMLVSLVGVTALGVGAWHLLTRMTERAPVPSAPAAVITAPAAPPSSPTVAEAHECPAPPACPPAPRPPPPQCTTGPHSEPPLDARGLRSLTYAVPKDPAARFELEVGLLTDARVALDERRSLDALGHVNRHKELFPTSAFEEERLAIEVVGKCQVSRPELAQEPFRRLLERAPRTTYLARIHDACGAAFGQPESEPGDE